jgi:hypothetical protein
LRARRKARLSFFDGKVSVAIADSRTGGDAFRREGSRDDKNLVKRAFWSKSAQVVDGMANINLQNVAGLPPAKCYSEYIE